MLLIFSVPVISRIKSIRRGWAGGERAKILIINTFFKFPTTIKIEIMIIKSRPHKTFKLMEGK